MDHANGHHPNWKVLSDIQLQIGRLQVGVERTHQELHTTRQELHAGLTRVHQRIDDMPKRRSIPELTGMSVKELLTYAILIILAINGTLNGETLAAWLAK